MMNLSSESPLWRTRCSVAAFVSLLVCLGPSEVAGQSRVASAEPMVRPGSAMSSARMEGVQAVVTVERLVLEGRTLDEAMASLAREGPRAGSGELANGITDYELLPRLLPVRSGAACRTQGVEVDARVRILLPEWPGSAAAGAHDRAAWRRFLDGLTAHETAHRDITLRAAMSLRDRLNRLQATNCPALMRRVARELAAAQDALDRAHLAVDREDAFLR